MTYDLELKIAREAASAAASYLRELSSIKINSSEGKDIKLQADIESEKLIIGILSRGTGYSILTEESGEISKIMPEKPYWVIDPLDGSLNLSRGIPFYSVSIALWINNEPILGVIYDVCRNEEFYGIVGMGAWANESEIYVSNVSDASNGIVATGFPSLASYTSENIMKTVSMIQKFKKVRLFGSAALSLAMVAAGRVDFYVENGIRFWDVAAGIALVVSAGGCVSYVPDGTIEHSLLVRCSCNARLIAND
jgi:myo-inositol-1(or 4)-monophosphatase